MRVDPRKSVPPDASIAAAFSQVIRLFRNPSTGLQGKKLVAEFTTSRDRENADILTDITMELI